MSMRSNLLASCKADLEEARRQIKLMEDGTLRTWEVVGNGAQRDTTPEAIERAKRLIVELPQIIARIEVSPDA